MDELKMHSPDLAQLNIAKIAELFPTVVTEQLDDDGNPVRVIDFDLLRQELSEDVVEGPQERHELDWPGKRAALMAANAPIMKTLRPVHEESVNFDTTKNIFIEGDNLDVLKLLQESYLGKVKLIYIDPPYNTGHDLLYHDTFTQTDANYLTNSGQIDETGARLVANTESNGRFHSDWLSMMLPRLKLARNLLSDDGLLFISIDDTEQARLRMLCDQIFGADMFLNQLVWHYGKMSNEQRRFANNHEYILVYGRSPESRLNTAIKKEDSEYRNRYINFLNESNQVTYGAVKHKSDNLIDLRIRKVEKELDRALVDSDVLFDFEHEFKRHSDTIYFPTIKGNAAERVPFGLGQKPVALLQFLVQAATTDASDFIVLDFFAGSGSTAEAVFRQNGADGGNRSVISVQLPEVCDPKSDAAKAGFPTITELAKSRIRSSAERLLLEDVHPAWRQDIGFRVLRLDSTNLADVRRTPDSLGQDELGLYTDSLRSGRTSEDLLFQVLLDWGLELTIQIAVEDIDGRDVFKVGDGALFACFADAVSAAVIHEVASQKPLRAVFRDSSFASDADRINAEQVFAEVSPATDVRTI
jgi:adenine-specific DNA-methyltransferase